MVRSPLDEVLRKTRQTDIAMAIAAVGFLALIGGSFIYGALHWSDKAANTVVESCLEADE